MRASTTAMKGALSSSFDWRWVADLFVDGVRVLQDAPITNVRLRDDSTALVQSSGSFTIAYQDVFAKTIAPAAIGDLLSPFGTRVSLSVLVTVGALQERIQMGWYLISDTPSIVAQMFLFKTALLSKGDLIDVNVKDLFSGIQRDRFNVPGSPPSLTSVWAEVQRIAEIPVTRMIADGPISATVAYQVDKLQAVYDLALVLDATACMLSDGTLSMRPIAWPASVDVLAGGDGGALVRVGKAMANDTVYNAVVVRSANTANGSAVLASAEIASGPLRTRNSDGSPSPYRRVPYFYSSQYITTEAQAVAYAEAWLPRVSQLRSVAVKVTELFNPLRELGDVITVKRYASGVVFEQFDGRILSIDRSGGAPTQDLLVAVNSTAMFSSTPDVPIPPHAGLFSGSGLFSSATTFTG